MCKKKDDMSLNKEYKYDLLLELCKDDYFRLIGFYKKIYDKINISLVFSGVLLTIIASRLDFSSLSQVNSNTESYRIVLIIVNFSLQIVSFILFSISLMLSIYLLKGKTLTFFNTEIMVKKVMEEDTDERNIEWVLNKYIECINENRKIVSFKEKKYNEVIRLIGLSTVLFLLSLLVRSVL